MLRTKENPFVCNPEDGNPIKKEDENEDQFNTSPNEERISRHSFSSNHNSTDDPCSTLDDEGCLEQGSSGKYMKFSSGHPYKCKSCDSGFFANLAEFYIHFDNYHRDQVQIDEDLDDSDITSESNVQYGNYYNIPSGLQHPIAVQSNQFKHK